MRHCFSNSGRLAVAICFSFLLGCFNSLTLGRTLTGPYGQVNYEVYPPSRKLTSIGRVGACPFSCTACSHVTSRWCPPCDSWHESALWLLARIRPVTPGTSPALHYRAYSNWSLATYPFFSSSTIIYEVLFSFNRIDLIALMILSSFFLLLCQAFILLTLMEKKVQQESTVYLSKPLYFDLFRTWASLGWRLSKCLGKLRLIVCFCFSAPLLPDIPEHRMQRAEEPPHARPQPQYTGLPEGESRTCLLAYTCLRSYYTLYRRHLLGIGQTKMIYYNLLDITGKIEKKLNFIEYVPILIISAYYK